MSTRSVLLIIGSLLAMLFVSQNLDSVEVSLLWGRPVEAPLALVIGAAFLVGVLAGSGLVLGRFRRGTDKPSTEEMHWPE
ncbi:lipopolysaccharide assembly protein A [Azospirillaceae bacterium]|nr:hypothetical protein MTCCP1_00009 [uncultured bacterium]